MHLQQDSGVGSKTHVMHVEAARVNAKKTFVVKPWIRNVADGASR